MLNDGNTILLVMATMMLTCGLIFGSTYAIHRIRKFKISKLRDLFFLRREWLEADFLTRASESGNGSIAILPMKSRLHATELPVIFARWSA